MTNFPGSIDGIENVRVVRQYSDILGVDYRELHFDVRCSIDTDDRYDLVCRMGTPPERRAEREDLAIDDGVATQHVMATYHIDPPSSVFFGWEPGDHVELELSRVENNYRVQTVARDVTGEIASALADAEELTVEERLARLEAAVFDDG